jgi:hypothetical protein
VDWKNARMGTGYVTGTEVEIGTSLSARVGGPLSTLRAESASLLELLLDLRDRSDLWASSRSSLWRRRGPGSGSASGGPGGVVEDARPGRRPGRW